MYDRENATGAVYGADTCLADHEPPAMEEINHRLGQLNDEFAKALAGVNEFLSRCGRGSPPKGMAGEVRSEAPRAVGHVAEINSRINDLQGTSEFLNNAVRELRRIG